MPTTPEAIAVAIDEAVMPGFRGKLIARGQARAMIWRDGVLPPGAPEFSPQLTYDLESYAYSLLGLALRLRELGGDPDKARLAFEQAATALESVTARGDRLKSDRDFHLIIAAASYHLAHLSARAYSLLTMIRLGENFSPIERALAQLILRDFRAVEATLLGFKLSRVGSDEQIAHDLRVKFREDVGDVEGDDVDSTFLFESVNLAMTDNFFSALSLFLLALERGEKSLVARALAKLQEGLTICGEINLVPQWWSHRIAIFLFDDLWGSSFHEKLPLEPAGGSAADWPNLRDLFIGTLLRRSKVEVDLWPSQLAAGRRAVDQSDDLVISLPTSAGKTRIAELCILRCLAARKRVVFVTPLRALSAQTEMTLQRTFGPLGKSVSSLYGSIGASGLDEDALRKRHVVVATPEKLDFALRNDPTLLDDVGLLIFDEGHMIGLNEREVRYEIQIQRLLRRNDAHQRRIVCLSAILPDGDQLEDFANWLRRDQPGGIVKSDWRPTRLRYGEVIWNGQTARLNLRVGEERPFVPRFLKGAIPPIGRRKTIFPRNLGELCLATAWRLVEDGQTVLIFCPVRAHVEPFADRIVDLHTRGALPSLLSIDESVLTTAITLGEEWLGPEHPIIKCLKLGVAIHHGALPTAFRKEIERLLREGVLKVTISSPTLAQGLNLSATAVIFHSLYRNQKPIDIAEFRNVIGRAGRAYVDVEGLVLYPIFDNKDVRLKLWEKMVDDAGGRDMESGLLQLVIALLHRMHQKFGGDLDDLLEYVMNNVETWNFPEVLGESATDRSISFDNWNRHVSTLDTAILSLLGEHDIPDDDIAPALDDVLQSSLWERRLSRYAEELQGLLKATLVSRSKSIWQQSTAVRRRGYFLAGIGLQTGHSLDSLAEELNELLVRANTALLLGQETNAIDAITSIAEHIFQIYPFTPKVIPENWRTILRCWLFGQPLSQISAGQETDALQFVEDGLVYRLPWAMEAIRVRGIANGDIVDGHGLSLEDVDLSLAVASVETGTMNRQAAMLMQTGFNSRLAAIRAVTDTGASFTTVPELRGWLSSDEMLSWNSKGDWPTPATNEMWRAYIKSFMPRKDSTWGSQNFWAWADWLSEIAPEPGTPVRLFNNDGQAIVLSAEGEPIATLQAPLNPNRRGLVRATVDTDNRKVSLTYLGPKDLWLN